MAYDDPNSQVRREAFFTTAAGATTDGAKFRHFQAMRLKKVHAAVLTAGTATGHGYTIKNGTTSIGTIALSTSAAGVTASSGLLDSTVAALGQVMVTSLTDATGVAQIIFEYEVTPDAVES